MKVARRITGGLALGVYLIMGALLYLVVIPGAEGYYPPDFHLRGYDAAQIRPFVEAMTDEARAIYAAILLRWDRVFIVAMAAWLALMGWRGGGLRFVVAGLALLYAAVDLSENAAIHRFIYRDRLDADTVRLASGLTMAKFASLYLAGLVLLVHLRRGRA